MQHYCYCVIPTRYSSRYYCSIKGVPVWKSYWYFDIFIFSYFHTPLVPWFMYCVRIDDSTRVHSSTVLACSTCVHTYRYVCVLGTVHSSTGTRVAAIVRILQYWMDGRGAFIIWCSQGSSGPVKSSGLGETRESMNHSSFLSLSVCLSVCMYVCTRVRSTGMYVRMEQIWKTQRQRAEGFVVTQSQTIVTHSQALLCSEYFVF